MLVAGGLGNTSSSESAEIYAPETGAFTATAHLTTGRNNHTATLLLDGRVLLLGGSSDAANAELFEPCPWLANAAPAIKRADSSEWRAVKARAETRRSTCR